MGYAESLTAKYRNMISQIIGEESNLWPNTLQKMFIINAPWPFRFAWKILSNFIHPITVAKIDILGTDFLKTMKKTIAIDQIPARYGGKGALPIKMGYAADIEDALIDGDYSAQSDPIDVETVHCRRNANRERKESEEANAKDSQSKLNVNEEEKAVENVSTEEQDTEEKDGDERDEDEYVKVEK